MCCRHRFGIDCKITDYFWIGKFANHFFLQVVFFRLTTSLFSGQKAKILHCHFVLAFRSRPLRRSSLFILHLFVYLRLLSLKYFRSGIKINEIYFVFRSLIRNFGYRRNYFRSGIKRKIVFPFVFRSLIRNFAKIMCMPVDKQDKNSLKG